MTYKLMNGIDRLISIVSGGDCSTLEMQIH